MDHQYEKDNDHKQPQINYNKYPVLVVDDEQDNLDAFCFNFRRFFNLHTADSGKEALQKLTENDFAVLITDQRMPGMTGVELLRKAYHLRPMALGILLTAYKDVDVVIEALHLGHVHRYISKPWDSREMQSVIGQAIEHYHLKKQNLYLEARLREYAGYLEREAHDAFNFGRIVGRGEAFRQVLTRVEQVAPTNSSVLLRGETGTGKELVAHAIHINSPRHEHPFVKVNCASLAPGVLESELFGHEKGSFTGAVSRHLGRFELANGGTLFLDEIGDLPMEVQIKILRVLQEREFERIGGRDTIKTDVRVISATNRNLEDLISQGLFRQDLYYRLNVFPIFIPPLRERREDIADLVYHFLEKFSRSTGKLIKNISKEALTMLEEYAWPGNVRELENVIERAIIVAEGETIAPNCLEFGPAPGTPKQSQHCTNSGPIAINGVSKGIRPVATGFFHSNERNTSVVPHQTTDLTKRLEEEEQREIVRAIENNRGNIAAAARELRLNRSTLYYRLRKYSLEHLLPTRTDPPID